MARVFINYRRADSIAYAGRIYDRLAAEFGAGNVFMDIDTIRLGDDFVKVLHETALSCDAFLAVIGPQWLTVTDKEGRPRLGTAQDFVAIEIAAALERESILVVPVLVGGARMPDASELPKELAELARRQALTLPDVGFHRMMGELVESIREVEKQRLSRQEAEAAKQGEQDQAEQRRQQAERERTERAAREERERLERARRKAEASILSLMAAAWQGWGRGPKIAVGVAVAWAALTAAGVWGPLDDLLGEAVDSVTGLFGKREVAVAETSVYAPVEAAPVKQDPVNVMSRPPGVTGSMAQALVNEFRRVDPSTKVGPQIVYRYATIGEYQAAVQAKPNDADLRHDFGRALEEAGDSNGALEQYRLSTQASPNQIGRAFLYRDYAEALEKKGLLEEAIEAAQKSIVSWPRANSRSCFGSAEEELLSRLLVRGGQSGRAVAMWQETKRRDAANAAKCDEHIARVLTQTR